MSSDHADAPQASESGGLPENVAVDLTDAPALEPAKWAKWNVAEWHGRMILDSTGGRIGRLQDVYVDVETDEPMFATVRQGLIQRHITFVPVAGIQITPDALRVTAAKALVKSAPNLRLHGDELSQADESLLYHHFSQNYSPPTTQSGRRLARR